LPDDEQVTTARDQALLGRAIQERFPRYYRYFSTPSFTYRGESMRNHNRLLGHVEGVDGIKTGYTRASGFNLVTSVKRDNRHIVAVVLGGSSASSRDARMRDLIASYVADASNRRTATQVAEAPAEPRVPARPTQVAAAGGAYALASASSMPTPAAAAPGQSGLMVASKPQQVAAGSSEPLKPIAVKTIKVKLAGVEAAALAPSAPMIAVPEETGSTASAPKAAATQPAPPAAAAQPWSTPSKEPIKAAAWPAPAAAPAPEPAPAMKTQVVAKTEPAPAVKTAKAEPAPARKAQTHSGWIIQIGAFETAGEAKQRLDAAQSKAKSVLARADAFTEPVTKGDKTFYRARFAGLEKSQAEATCKQLKRSDISCMTLKN
jgi:D-alanyl-D-alanine carboxypeptidase